MVIAVGATIPLKQVGGGGWLDKPVHLCEYLVLAWLLHRAMRASGSARRPALVQAVLLAVAYGGSLEVVQSFLPYRQADWHDMAMNALGAIFGAGLAQWGPWR